MLGNVVTGCSVLAPAGMLSELSEGLDVSIRTAGLLITFGAIVLCVGSPVTAWRSSRVEPPNLAGGPSCKPACDSPGHARGRCALHAAGRRHRCADRAGAKARLGHCLHISQLVAGGR